MPVLHVPLKFWASGFRIKLSRCTVHRVCLLKKDFVPEGKGTLCQRGSPKVMGVYQAYFWAIFKKSSPFLTEKLNVLEAFEVLAR